MFSPRSPQQRKYYRQNNNINNDNNNYNDNNINDNNDNNNDNNISNMLWELQRVKVRGIGKQNKQYMRMSPTGVESKGLFGMNLITSCD